MSLEFWAGVTFAVGVGLIGWWVRDRQLLAQRNAAAAIRLKEQQLHCRLKEPEVAAEVAVPLPANWDT